MSDIGGLRKQRKEAMEEKRKKIDSLRNRRQGLSSSQLAEPTQKIIEDKNEKQLAAEPDACDELVRQLLDSPIREIEKSKQSVTSELNKTIAIDEERGEIYPEPIQESSAGITEEKVIDDEVNQEIKDIIVEIPVVKVDVYDKECQTDADQLMLDKYLRQKDKRLSLNSIDRGSISDGETSTEEQANVVANSDMVIGPKRLTEEEKTSIIASDSFKKFLKRSGGLVERALNEVLTFDILTDYSRGDVLERNRGSEKLHEVLCLQEPSLCEDRAVTDLHWSPHFPELILVSFSASGKGQALDAALLCSSLRLDATPDGLVLIYSLALPARPEFVLHAQSPVMTARFHEFNEHLVIGGCYSGQIVTWDLRSNSLPTQQTTMTQSAHTHPVYGMAMEGSVAAHSLVTASTDGKIIWWNPTQLSQHLEALHLTLPQSTSDALPAEDVTVSCIACVPGADTVQLLVGTEKGGVMIASVHTRGSGALHQLKGHHGLVTALDTHPSTSKALQGLVLSSSVDWTTSLWSLNRSDQPVVNFGSDSYDYICDVRWSPTHPALFATANVAGEVALWNLNINIDAPVVPPTKVKGGTALTKLSWSRKGRRLAVGDVNGCVHVYSVAEDIACPRHDEEQRLERLLDELCM